MENRKRICRFCLENCGTNFKAIERSTYETLNMLLVTMDLAISDESVMCTTCSEVLQKCFVFKETCLNVRGRSVAFSSDQKKGHAVCELCMNPFKNCSLTALDIEEDIISKKTMLEKHFPELGASKKLIVCEACHGSLVIFFSFITTSSIVEEKIKKYREAENVNDTDPIKLNKVIQFTSENVWNENDIIKMESVESDEENMEIQGEMCTLCLEQSETTKTVDENTRNILDIVLPQIDYPVIRGPAMCINCVGVLIKCFEFKATCLHTHSYIVPFLDNKDHVKLELKDVYLSKNATGTDVPEDQDVCGLCMGLVNNCSAISLDVEEGDVTLEIMINQCLPELDLSIIKKPVICAPCHGSLEDCFHFVTNCLIKGEKIKERCVTPDINREGQIEISSALQFTIKDAIKKEVDDYSADTIKVEEKFLENRKYPDEREISRRDTVKLEPIFFDDSEDAIDGVENKSKSFKEMNDQEVDNARQFTPENKVAHALESIKLGCIKIEEVEEENETNHREKNLVEMEDHKILFNEEIAIKTEERDFDRFENGIILNHSEVIRGIHRRKKCAALNLTLTKENISKIRMYQRDLFSFQTKHKKSLISHNLITEGDEDPSEITMYKCDSCSFQTKHKNYLKVHILKHKNPSEITMYKCDSCSYQTKHKNYLKVHILKHKNPSEITMYKCDSCSFQAKRKDHLKKHLLQHKDPSEITMYRCDSCLFQTKRKDHLKKHLLQHKDPSEVIMYKCDSCSFQTKRKDNLKKHLLHHKDPSEITMYKCDSCSFQTKRKISLEEHMLQHKSPSEITMYKCDSCLFQTKKKKNLRLHMLQHKNPSEITMYRCDSCTFQTKHKRSLKRHLLQHKDLSETTMYKCDACLFQTRIKRNLKVHMLQHKDPSEVTMYKCDSCLYQARRKSGLKRHLVIHKNPSEVTMYECNSCSYQTKHKGCLKKHSLKHKDLSAVTM